jgi:hypothetical protein
MSWHHGSNATKGRACATKRAHGSRWRAERELERLVRRGAVNLIVYPCPTGQDHYHVGHRPGSRRKR